MDGGEKNMRNEEEGVSEVEQGWYVVKVQGWWW